MIRLNVRGGSQLAAKLRDKMIGPLDPALMVLALDGERFIKQSFGRSPAPPGLPPGVDTGALKAGIKAKPAGHFKKKIVSSAEYGPHLEFGTIHMSARPFMRPGARYLANAAPDILTDFYRKVR